jgi:hypothetical protein
VSAPGWTLGDALTTARLRGAKWAPIVEDDRRTDVLALDAAATRIAADLVARGVRDRYALDEVSLMLAPFAGQVVSPVVPLPVRLAAYRLSGREEQVLRAVDGARTLAELTDHVTSTTSVEAGEVHRAVLLGLSCEIVTCERWTALVSRAHRG